MWKKQIAPDEKVPLELTATERTLAFEDVTCLDPDYEQIIRDTPSGKPVMMTLGDLDDFGEYVAAEANHCDDNKRQKKLDRQRRSGNELRKRTPASSINSRSRSSDRSLRFGGGFKFRNARSTSCTSISRRRWGGPIPISMSSRSRGNDTATQICWTRASRISSAKIQQQPC